MRTLLFIFQILLLSTSLFAQSNSDTLRKHVVRLSTLPYARNAHHLESLNKTANYIYDYFSQITENVFLQKYAIDDTVFKNVIASFGPDSGSRIIVGAHYDVFGEAPGADYNASGIAGLLELAKLLKTIEKSLSYRIDIVAYTKGENSNSEIKSMGSYVHAQSLYENKIPVLGMINLDGIGFFQDKPKCQRFPFVLYKWLYGRRANFIAIVQQPGNGLWGRQIRSFLNQYRNGLRFIHFKPAVPFKGFADGDHQNYAAFSYSALLITDTKFYRNKNYHYDIDTYETLDYFRMAKVVNMVFKSIIRYRQ